MIFCTDGLNCKPYTFGVMNFQVIDNHNGPFPQLREPTSTLTPIPINVPNSGAITVPIPPIKVHLHMMQ
ncbi:hypothetical protein [Nostoc sp.]|uniref:hypothetical protein n=1 Tax=Nostoc sp. TaxID=1180 RepID=UPI002FFC5928